MTTGDAGHKSNAQNTSSLSGKVLRLNMDGTIPADNPIPGSPVWSWGHRNSEGLAFAENGILYNSENGDASDDEINIIKKGANYGWPDVEGYCDKPAEVAYCRLNHITEPIKAWTPTIAPAGLVYYNADRIPEWKHSLLMGTLKGNSLRVLKLDKAGLAITQERVYFEMELGRIRSLCVSPAGDVYLSTSNRDWNPAPGFPKKGDDRIVKLTRSTSAHQNTIARVNMPLKSAPAKLPPGSKLYMSYCASCHKSNGNGVAGTFPPLSGSEYVTGSKGKILSIVMKGLNGGFAVKGIKYNQEMPSFAFMSDEQIRLVVNFVRINFGNHAQLVTLADVKKARKMANRPH